MRMHMHMHMHIQYKQVMQMHMCARLIPQLVGAHRGRIMFGISSLFSDQQHPTYPARIFSPKIIAPPAHDVPRGAWRAASTSSSSSSIDYTRFILFMISFLSCRRPSLLFRIYLIRRHPAPPCIYAPQNCKKKETLGQTHQPPRAYQLSLSDRRRVECTMINKHERSGA